MASKDWREQLKDIWPLFPAALYLLLFLVVVLVYLFYIGFTYGGAFPTLAPAQNVFTNPLFVESLINTLLFVVVGTPLELFVGLFLAIQIYQSYCCRSLIRSFFVIPLATPGLVVATLLYILFNPHVGFMHHLVQGNYWFFPQITTTAIDWRENQFFALGISLFGKVWRDMPLAMLILLSGLNSIDEELLDAAQTLGAGLRIRMMRIILPLLFPAMTTVLLLRSVEMWKAFLFPHVLAGNHYLLGTLIEMFAIGFQKENEAAVVALVLVVCIVVTLGVILLSLTLLKKLFIDPGVKNG